MDWDRFYNDFWKYLEHLPLCKEPDPSGSGKACWLQPDHACQWHLYR